MTRPFVSVVIPVRDDSARLRGCLRSLREQTYTKDRYEIVVVDNASREDVRSVVAEADGVRYAYEGKRGPAAARNKGVATARGAVIAFTDSDCLPAPDWLERGVAVLMGTPDCGLVGGDIRFLFRDPDRPSAVELVDTRHFRQKDYVERGGFAATANAFARRAVFEGAGPFDESFDGPAYEDKEWGERVSAKGYRVVYAEDAFVHHPARRTLADLCRKVAAGQRGEHQYARGTSLARGLGGLLRPPSLRRWSRIIEGREPGAGCRRRIEVCLVAACVHYVAAAARLRLALTNSRS